MTPAHKEGVKITVFSSAIVIDVIEHCHPAGALGVKRQKTFVPISEAMEEKKDTHTPGNYTWKELHHMTTVRKEGVLTGDHSRNSKVIHMPRTCSHEHSVKGPHNNVYVKAFVQ